MRVNKEDQSDIKSENKTRTIEAFMPITIVVGNDGAVEVFVNGSSLFQTGASK